MAQMSAWWRTKEKLHVIDLAHNRFHTTWNTKSSVTPQVVPRHNWSGRTIHGRFGCHDGPPCRKCMVPLFILLHMSDTGSLATCSLPSIIYMVKYKAAERGGGTWGNLPWSPHCLWTSKDRYTLIEQSSTLLRQSPHIFSLGPSSSFGGPG